MFSFVTAVAITFFALHFHLGSYGAQSEQTTVNHDDVIRISTEMDNPLKLRHFGINHLVIIDKFILERPRLVF